MIHTTHVAHMVKCMNAEAHFTTYNFPLFQKTDWSRMPTGDKHIMKYLVYIFLTIRRKFLFLLCPKIYHKTNFQHLNQWRNNCK